MKNKETVIPPVDKAICDLIVNYVADYNDVSVEALKSACKDRELVDTRRQIYYFAKKYDRSVSNSYLALILSRDPSSIVNALKVYNGLLDVDKNVKLHNAFLNSELKKCVDTYTLSVQILHNS